jgi:pyruvate dehydrogenase E2 component (dihydrolipoamide acetyltransferase)
MPIEIRRPQLIYAIINLPQAGILGFGEVAQQPVAVDGSVVIATLMTCTLSADHRVLDGLTGARFLSAFEGYIEQRLTMIL